MMINPTEGMFDNISERESIEATEIIIIETLFY